MTCDLVVVVVVVLVSVVVIVVVVLVRTCTLVPPWVLPSFAAGCTLVGFAHQQNRTLVFTLVFTLTFPTNPKN